MTHKPKNPASLDLMLEFFAKRRVVQVTVGPDGVVSKRDRGRPSIAVVGSSADPFSHRSTTTAPLDKQDGADFGGRNE